MVANDNAPAVSAALRAAPVAAKAQASSAAAEFLFPDSLLRGLDWPSITGLKGGVTGENPGEGLKVRPLRRSDYDRGFLDLLGHLTKVGDISKQEFSNRFDLMVASKGHYYVTVIEDTRKNKIVGAATLFVEYKFIRECAKRARLEDVVVSEEYRGKQLGKIIVSTITLLAKSLGCYKIGLDCTDAMMKFYSSLGYGAEPGNANTMIIRF